MNYTIRKTEGAEITVPGILGNEGSENISSPRGAEINPRANTAPTSLRIQLLVRKTNLCPICIECPERHVLFPRDYSDF